MKIIFAVAIFTIIYLVGLDFSERYLDTWEYTPPNKQEAQEIKNLEVNALITGAIEKPGTYTLSKGASLLDLIEESGGLKEQADLLAFNDYIEIKDDNSYYIPFKKLDQNNVCEKISINSSDAELLMQLSGIGETYAHRIIEYRTNKGYFKYLEEIKKVSGIGDITFENIKEKITL